jgi:hypothetical protein
MDTNWGLDLIGSKMIIINKKAAADIFYRYPIGSFYTNSWYLDAGNELRFSKQMDHGLSLRSASVQYAEQVKERLPEASIVELGVSQFTNRKRQQYTTVYSSEQGVGHGACNLEELISQADERALAGIFVWFNAACITELVSGEVGKISLPVIELVITLDSQHITCSLVCPVAPLMWHDNRCEQMLVWLLSDANSARYIVKGSVTDWKRIRSAIQVSGGDARAAAARLESLDVADADWERFAGCSMCLTDAQVFSRNTLLGQANWSLANGLTLIMQDYKANGVHFTSTFLREPQT